MIIMLVKLSRLIFELVVRMDGRSQRTSRILGCRGRLGGCIEVVFRVEGITVWQGNDRTKSGLGSDGIFSRRFMASLTALRCKA